jgi:D-3-phosphoglycerate dehydrogenase
MNLQLIAIIMLAACSKSVVAFGRNAAALSSSQRAVAPLVVRGMADIAVEHGRGEWKTYGDLSSYKPGKFQVKCFNKISPVGLAQFPEDLYDVRLDGQDGKNAHAILLRSHKLQEDEVAHTVRAIARCGAGTNNIPVSRMTELGIPVFNTPGANANAVKELVICGMLLGSRRIVDGINHMKKLGEQGLARERVEKDKAMFGGQELEGKRLAVIGLGHIGSLTARDAYNLGMKLSGYDPGLSIQSALKLPRDLTLADSIASAVSDADYVSINIPYIKGENGTHGIIGEEVISHFKPNTVLLNFARGELVDSQALKTFLDNGNGRYVSDFPDDLLWDHKNAIILPHLGASTEEAEDAAASMAADTIREFLETGAIRNSVNFPETELEHPEGAVRFTVVNKNLPGMLAHITEVFAQANLNIIQQINHSRGDIAYNVIDVDTSDKEDVLSFKNLQEQITMLDGVINSRIIYGTPGTGFARNLEGKYFV